MIRKLILLAVLQIGCMAQGRAASEEEIWQRMNSNTITVASFMQGENIPGRSKAVLAMPFSSAHWKNELRNKIPPAAIVESVQLVSTTFASSPDFNQEKLDRDRLHNLLSMLPQLAGSELTEWKRVRETNARTVEEGRSCFHGFVIIYRKPVTAALMKEEIETLENLFAPPGKKEAPKKESPAKKEKAISKTAVLYEGDTMVHLKGYIYSGDATGFEKVRADAIKPVVSCIAYSYGEPALLPVCQGWSDTIVTAVFNRNKQWKEMLVVCDITGSMSPYTSQLLAWFKLNTLNNRVKNFVFFNDGDMTPDASKVAGACGGIYGVRASAFDTVMKTAIYAMRKGYGGDAPENNVEATTYGLKNYGDAKEIVMIADNWATPRDLAFADEITRPVRIIVCGGFYGINTAYLDLARKTGGSVHTMEKDLTDLATLHEGETISIGKFNYKLEGGKFIKLAGS